MSRSRLLPVGYRFRPTDVELITHYLAPKLANSRGCHAMVIGDVELHKVDPWDLPGKAKLTGDGHEWYFFSRTERKYRRGSLVNRAAPSGYWKSTGADRRILRRNNAILVGMKKTLVFYSGKAPKGEKTSWLMHEYRLVSGSHRADKDQMWVLCKVMNTGAGVNTDGVVPEKGDDVLVGFWNELMLGDDQLLSGSVARVDVPEGRSMAMAGSDVPPTATAAEGDIADMDELVALVRNLEAILDPETLDLLRD